MRKESEKSFAHGESRGALYLLLTVLVGVALFLGWATTSEIDEMARGRGKVIALARTQVIQVVDGGVLERLLVEEGDTVSKGDLLAELDPNRAQASYEDSAVKVAALLASKTRLRSEVLGTEMIFPESLDASPQLVEDQKMLYLRRKKSLEDSTHALSEQLSVYERELGVVRPLLDRGDIGLSEVLRLERETAEVRAKIVNQRNSFFADAQSQLVEVEEKLQSEEQKLRERRSVLKQTKIHAPLDGVINKIEVRTSGAALRAGATLMEMLPIGGKMIVEAKFSPKDLAALKIGQTADVQFDAFDSSIYGSAPGEVIYISPNTLMERDARRDQPPYYQVHVRIDQEKLARAEGRTREISLLPGMTCNVAVRTGKRTVAQYLAKPVIKTLDGAFGER